MKDHLLNINTMFFFENVAGNIWSDDTFCLTFEVCMHILRQHFHQKIAPHERQFSWHLSNILVINIGRKIKPAGCFILWHNFANMSIWHAWPYSWWANVFVKSIKTVIIWWPNHGDCRANLRFTRLNNCKWDNRFMLATKILHNLRFNPFFKQTWLLFRQFRAKWRNQERHPQVHRAWAKPSTGLEISQ